MKLSEIQSEKLNETGKLYRLMVEPIVEVPRKQLSQAFDFRFEVRFNVRRSVAVSANASGSKKRWRKLFFSAGGVSHPATRGAQRPAAQFLCAAFAASWRRVFTLVGLTQIDVVDADERIQRPIKLLRMVLQLFITANEHLLFGKGLRSAATRSASMNPC